MNFTEMQDVFFATALRSTQDKNAQRTQRNNDNAMSVVIVSTAAILLYVLRVEERRNTVEISFAGNCVAGVFDMLFNDPVNLVFNFGQCRVINYFINYFLPSFCII